MFLRSLLKPGQARAAGERLYAATVGAARAPRLYAELGAPDTPDGRFEVYTLHVLLVLERLILALATEPSHSTYTPVHQFAMEL